MGQLALTHQNMILGQAMYHGLVSGGEPVSQSISFENLIIIMFVLFMF